MQQGRLAVTVDDLLAIHNVLGRYAHIMDAGSRGLCSFDEFVHVFTEDAVFDFTECGGPQVNSRAGIVAIMAGSQHPSGHHSTNFVIEEVDADHVTCLSKILSVEANGQANTGHYFDEIVRTEEGWRIRNRKATVYFAAGRP